MSRREQQTASVEEGPLLSYADVEQILRCSRDTVERRVKAGELGAVVRNGRRRLLQRAAVEAYIERNTEQVA